MQRIDAYCKDRLSKLEDRSDIEAEREQLQLALYCALATLAWVVWLRCVFYTLCGHTETQSSY